MARIGSCRSSSSLFRKPLLCHIFSAKLPSAFNDESHGDDSGYKITRSVVTNAVHSRCQIGASQVMILFNVRLPILLKSFFWTTLAPTPSRGGARKSSIWRMPIVTVLNRLVVADTVDAAPQQANFVNFFVEKGNCGSLFLRSTQHNQYSRVIKRWRIERRYRDVQSTSMRLRSAKEQCMFPRRGETMTATIHFLK